jgi:hypothetical protein
LRHISGVDAEDSGGFAHYLIGDAYFRSMPKADEEG